MTHDHPAKQRHQRKCQISKMYHGLEIRRIVDKHFAFLPPWNPQTVDLGKTRLRSQRHRLTGNLRLWLSKSVCFGGIGHHHDQQQGRCAFNTALEILGVIGQKSSWWKRARLLTSYTAPVWVRPLKVEIHQRTVSTDGLHSKSIIGQ